MEIYSGQMEGVDSVRTFWIYSMLRNVFNPTLKIYAFFKIWHICQKSKMFCSIFVANFCVKPLPSVFCSYFGLVSLKLRFEQYHLYCWYYSLYLNFSKSINIRFLALGAGCWEFESLHPDQTSTTNRSYVDEIIEIISLFPL